MLSTHGWELDPTTYATLFIAISVGLQVFVFVLRGSLADYGGLRKRLLVGSTIIGSAVLLVSLAVTKETWWLGAW